MENKKYYYIDILLQSVRGNESKPEDKSIVKVYTEEELHVNQRAFEFQEEGKSSRRVTVNKNSLVNSVIRINRFYAFKLENDNRTYLVEGNHFISADSEKEGLREKYEKVNQKIKKLNLEKERLRKELFTFQDPILNQNTFGFLTGYICNNTNESEYNMLIDVSETTVWLTVWMKDYQVIHLRNTCMKDYINTSNAIIVKFNDRLSVHIDHNKEGKSYKDFNGLVTVIIKNVPKEKTHSRDVKFWMDELKFIEEKKILSNNLI